MKNIYKKMLEIQKMNLSFEKDSANPFFKSKYISLDNIVAKLSPILSEKGLLVYHCMIDNKIYSSVVDVESEEKIESMFPLIDSNDPQKLGSAISYAKRYNLGQLFNIITDRDDDGNLASDKKVVEKIEPKKLQCENCKVDISEAVSKFSKDKFGKALCMDCQNFTSNKS